MLEVTLLHYSKHEAAISPELGATVANALSAHSRLLGTDDAVDFVGRVHSAHVIGTTAKVLDEIRGYIEELAELESP